MADDVTDGPRPNKHSPSPTEIDNPRLRREFEKAAVWIGLAVLVYVAIQLAQPLLLIFAALVIATMLDGGVRLLGRALPIWRGVRLAVVVLAILGFLGWVFYLTGSQLSAQFQVLQITVLKQFENFASWIASMGVTVTADEIQNMGARILGSVGRVTQVVTGAFGAVAALALIFVLGIFLAAEPRLYERGVAWMLPSDEREPYYKTLAKMGSTMRRLMAGRLIGMLIEGVGTWILLTIGGVPMAALLGILTGLLAFIPNVGAVISGVLILSVGFSAGVDTGLFALAVYVGVQLVDGYLIVPMVAKRAVDLAPALVLSAQILFGSLFGILGLALADPIVAMIKVFLERRTERKEAKQDEGRPHVVRASSG